MKNIQLNVFQLTLFCFGLFEFPCVKVEEVVWQYIPGVDFQAYNFEESKSLCEQRNATLLQIASEEDIKRINQFYATEKPQTLVLGHFTGHNVTNNTTWFDVYPKGSNVNKFLNDEKPVQCDKCCLFLIVGKSNSNSSLITKDCDDKDQKGIACAVPAQFSLSYLEPKINGMNETVNSLESKLNKTGSKLETAFHETEKNLQQNFQDELASLKSERIEKENNLESELDETKKMFQSKLDNIPEGPGYAMSMFLSMCVLSVAALIFIIVRNYW